MKIQLIPKVYFLMLPALFISVLHLPYFVLPDMHIDLMLLYFYIIFSNKSPHIVSLVLFGLAKDLLQHDVLFVSSLLYVIFAQLTLLSATIIPRKAFFKVWLGYVGIFTAIYLLYLLIQSIMWQHVLLNWMLVADLCLSYAAYPLMHCLFYWWRVGRVL